MSSPIVNPLASVDLERLKEKMQTLVDVKDKDPVISAYTEEIVRNTQGFQPSGYDPSREVFVFNYKKGHSVITIHFQSASLSDAVSEAKEVCRMKRWTWIGVTPFLRDIKRLMKEE